MFAGSKLPPTTLSDASINQEKRKHMAKVEMESLGLLLTSGSPNFKFFPCLKLKLKSKNSCIQEHHLIAWKRRQATLISNDYLQDPQQSGAADLV